MQPAQNWVRSRRVLDLRQPERGKQEGAPLKDPRLRARVVARAAETLVVDTMMDSRREILRLLGRLEVSSWRQGVKTLCCVLGALGISYLPAIPSFFGGLKGTVP